MTVIELNDYIKHYLEEDKTHTAIMLTGEWGSGKTYYIENKLVPFLQNSQKNRCVVISLYGVENISEISKSIYMELRMKALARNSEIIETGKIMAKTIVKGVAGIFGFDANMPDDDLQNLYSSVDLSGKLLILEDLERSHIEITKLLGYINNLVERDGVKVLVVANENEILNKPMETFNFDFTKLFSSTLKNNNEEDNKNSIPDNNEQVQKYLRIKEKTISDTIYFESNYCEAVKNIIAIFCNEKLQKIIAEEEDMIDELASMVRGYCHKNFRTFIFATQKAVDIFDKMEENYENDFLKCIYFGIICFSPRIKAGEFPEWEGTEYFSTLLGTNWHPLFRFCYDYIRWQKIDRTQISKARDAYNKMKLYDENAERNDIDLQKLYSYADKTEAEVREALKSIEERLEDSENIGFYSYGKLAAYLVIICHVIGFDYTVCKERMVRNIKGKGDEIDSDLLFLPMYDFEGEEKREFEDFIGQLSESMNFKNTQNEFSYNPNDLKDLYEFVIKEKYKISNSHEFISRYDVAQLVEMLFCASSKQIMDFRGALFAVYRYAGKTDFVEADINAMREILELIQQKINSNDYQRYAIDKIQLKQIGWLCDNLNTFILQMS